MAWEKRQQVHRDTDRSHARAATAVRNAKSLVQIEMANIRADIARAAEADLRIHVRAVHVNLTAMRVHDFANLADGGLRKRRGLTDRSP